MARRRRRLSCIGRGVVIGVMSTSVLAPAYLPAATRVAGQAGAEPLAPPEARAKRGGDADVQGLRLSAQVDKTTVEVGSQLTLTLTIEGEFAKAELQPFEFPKALPVVAQSRSTNLSIQLGRVQRSVSLVYVLLAKEPGTFQLGPFQVTYQGKPILTDPIQIVVSKPVLPPHLEEHERITL